MAKNKGKVLVAMSGGVDSSVAAALLKEQGYDLIGVTMQVWPSQKALGGCCSLDAVNDAKAVADKLGIPHYTLNFRNEFKAKVIDDFVSEYKRGRTPNPCIRCNQFIKFDYLMRKARELGAEYVATGHYARILGGSTKYKLQSTNYKLQKGLDRRKDQAYVLYMMNQEMLAHTLFPLGELTKEQVRTTAKDLGLAVHDKEESQEICFIEDDNYGRFLKEVCPEAVKPGPILDMKGNVVGKHDGIAFYTLGQRKGVGAHRSLPKYVVRIDVEKNAVIIGDQEDTLGTELIADHINYVSSQEPFKPLDVMAKIRYNSTEEPAVLYPLEKDNGQDKVKVIFKKPQRAITPGQSVVFYKGDEVLGGGIIN